ncbi:MAG: hypothetical protein AAF594_05650 [Bacteroidota bacterium]
MPSHRIATFRRAHAESERGLAFAAFVDRLTAREAGRDPQTGLTPAEAAAERMRPEAVRRVRVESAHNPLLARQA